MTQRSPIPKTQLKRISAVIFLVAAVLFLIAAAESFFSHNTAQGSVFFCVAITELSLGAAFLAQSKKPLS